MDDATFIGHLWEHGLGLADAAEAAGLDTPVRSCPGWSVADLVWHITEVQDFWNWVVAERAIDPSTYPEAQRPTADGLLTGCRRGVDTLVATLRDADPNDAVWSWAPGGNSVGWVVRRQAHEAAMHRWDAETAAGNEWAIPADLAVEGIDEFFEFMAEPPAEGAAPLGGTVHLHCTDADGEWLVAEPEPGGPLTVTREHAKGDVAVRATASDLLLLLWRRVDLDTAAARLELFGDAAVASRLLQRSDLG
jgi:uncharacterized protein (TIGR03083 family)